MRAGLRMGTGTDSGGRWRLNDLGIMDWSGILIILRLFKERGRARRE